MRELREFLAKQPPSAILRDTLGFPSLSGVNYATQHAKERIATLLDHAVVIGIDTEAWTKNTNEMTEIGLAVYEKKDMVQMQKQSTSEEKEESTEERGAVEYIHLGPFGEHLLNKITFHHLRIVETAHLHTNAPWLRGADGNRFGHSRFVTFAEARTVLDSFFHQPISPPPSLTTSNPDPSPNTALLSGLKPIILLGHAMFHDLTNCRTHGLQYDWAAHGTVVAAIDTQPLAKATRTWCDPAAPSNDVGLETLTRALGFEHRDAHTACNDAARTVMCAVLMVLPGSCKEKGEEGMAMQDVAWRIEEGSRERAVPEWGSGEVCTRCGGRDHGGNKGEVCRVEVWCAACRRYDSEEADECWTTHIEQYCPHVAEYNAWVRRRDDAVRKGNTVPRGPPVDSHPALGHVTAPRAGTSPPARIITSQSAGRVRGGKRVQSSERSVLSKSWRRKAG